MPVGFCGNVIDGTTLSLPGVVVVIVVIVLVMSVC